MRLLYIITILLPVIKCLDVVVVAASEPLSSSTEIFSGSDSRHLRPHVHHGVHHRRRLEDADTDAEAEAETDAPAEEEAEEEPTEEGATEEVADDGEGGEDGEGGDGEGEGEGGEEKETPEEVDDELRCAYYVERVNDYEPNRYKHQQPQQICSELDLHVKDEKSNMCCGYYAREDILNGTGPFSVSYEIPIIRNQKAASDEAARCYAYVDVLEDTICSRFQGQYMSSDNVFQVCQSSCDAVYEVCVREHIISRDFASDGKSFCEAAWGDPCERIPESYFCKEHVTVEVVESNENCIGIITPTEGHVNYYLYHSTELDGCMFVEGVTVWFDDNFWWLVLALAILVLCCCGMCCFCAGRFGKKGKGGSSGNKKPPPPVVT